MGPDNLVLDMLKQFYCFVEIDSNTVFEDAQLNPVENHIVDSHRLNMYSSKILEEALYNPELFDAAEIITPVTRTIEK